MRLSIVLFALFAFACQQGKSKLDNIASGSGGSAGGPGSGSAAAAVDIDSKQILSRPAGSESVLVKHVLLAWKDLEGAYRGKLDPRAAKRTNAEAAQLARQIAAKLAANPDAIDAVIKESSEDPDSLSGDPYSISKNAKFLPKFDDLALRLRIKEVGIIQTPFGYHVVERVAPPPPDPLESGDLLARVPEHTSRRVQHVLIGWKDAPANKRRPGDPRAKDRTKDAADKMAVDVLAKARAGADFAKLMKEFSEDPGSKDNARAYEVSEDAPLVEPFKNLSMRLKLNEVGMVKSDFGWHVIKRVEPPPPDPLESADILAREPATAKAKVKHILLGWTEAHTDDARGTKRTHKELQKLVTDTVSKLKGGAKIDDLMKELSEDPGSAKSGTAYDVNPEAQLVPPFKNLSLRLKLNEVGVVKSDFGMHIIQRTE
jgi:parvulin-like peptidyl-prolyl isomerase